MKTRKLRLLSFVLAVAMMLAVMPVSAFAADNVTSGRCGDDATWALTEDNNGDYTLTISGTGAMQDYSEAVAAPWSWAKHRIRAIAIGDEITAIGAYAFKGCDRFYAITIPASVTTICQSAFQSCTSLETIDLSNAINLKTINSKAFYYCYNLNEVTIPSNVISIGSDAFDKCISLKRVTLLNGVQEIGSAAFMDCNSLKYVDIPESVTKIDASAFAYCSTLGNIAIPASVREIGNGAFKACINLKTITFAPNSQLTNVGDNVFNTCYAKIYCEPALAGVLNGKTGDATIVSQVTVKINYDGIGGEDTEITVDYPSQVKEEPATPSAEGYTFLGWYDENDNEFDFSKPVTQNITVTAKWVKDHQLTVKGGTFTFNDNAAADKGSVYEGAVVTVTLDENDPLWKDGGLSFDHWDIQSKATLLDENGEEIVNPGKTFTFVMPEEGVTVEAVPKTAAAEDDSLDAAAVVTGVVLGTGTAIFAYHIGIEVYAEQVLGKGVAIPRTREEVALKAWELAGKPAVELNGEPLSEAAQAEKWAVESGLMQNVDGSFNGSKKMSKLKALRTLDAAKKLG